MKKNHHCGRFRNSGVSRRDLLRSAACGFGSVAFAALAMENGDAFELIRGSMELNDGPMAPKAPHYAPKVKNIIYLYMDGGPSQVDTFDPKPLLEKEHGTPFKMKIEPTQFNNIGTTMASPWKFKPYGQSGIPVSELFPHVAQHVDDLAVIRSMQSEFSEHTNANFFLHTGSGFQGRPSMGAWIGYGLGSESQNLPGFIVLNGGLIPPGGLDCFNSGFLPASYQGSIFNAGSDPLANIQPTEASPQLQRNKLRLLQQLDRRSSEVLGGVDKVESAIVNYELAFNMQAAVPELAGLEGETEETKEMYGMNAQTKGTATFGRQCLIARRLVERGVRFIELTCPNIGYDRWDQHGNLKMGHFENARAVDQPIGALLTDLKQRGLFDETLVVWSGEFGRTPFAQGSDGRDHNPFGFSLWLAGGGIRGGTIYGATDEYGYKAIENRTEIFDLHATMLHLLGIDHKRLTYRWSGRDMRLTDVHGHVIHAILS
ncbi:MAG TPA: DUF1501 domain-containing protein [Pirellulaceae bacterium]|nr:DUF1501 domain-containing protein [Pirellulaceae bacterium]HMO91909.1 DUF1501 domain-containing protein [Pirellulaceae bacterium]HMP68709.1 DUF1501 domain-containing protein [Pirellulaceae bacterium]